MLISSIGTTVDADHGQYLVVDHDAEFTPRFTTGGTGLIGSLGDMAVVCTGTEYGPVRLTIEAHDGPPDLVLDSWDEVVDVSIDLPSGRLTVMTLMSGPAATVDLGTDGGAYWLRMRARGRDDARLGPTDGGDPAEEHLIAVWPAAEAPDIPHAVVYKATDGVGAYHRQAEARQTEARLGRRPSTTVEFRSTPSHWSIKDWVRWPDEPGVRVTFNEPVLRSVRLDLTVTAVDVYRTGCLILLNVRARPSDLDPARWEWFRDVVGHGFGFPGHSLRRPPHPEALRLDLAWRGQPPVISAKARKASSRQPDGPTLVGYFAGATGTADLLVADHQAWLWPRPPALPLLLTVAWPALEVPPTTVTLDGERIAAARSGGR